jgi:hypothetical protein
MHEAQTVASSKSTMPGERKGLSFAFSDKIGSQNIGELSSLTRAHGLRNEMHFCDEKSSQARPMLQLFADHRTENISALWMWKCCEEHFQAK